MGFFFRDGVHEDECTARAMARVTTKRYLIGFSLSLEWYL